ncbi:hypothetical protein PC119_g24987 [Phytophthora cactorum]|nr:hypothetical protein PC119_g24987 [Phytophthora cactorum]
MGFWSALDAMIGEYAHWDLWPAYGCVILVWIVTSPFRDVILAYILQVWLFIGMNRSKCYECAALYRGVLRDSEQR